ncbi:Gfo/Idh/MocA family oxidoreductase [Kitasatospora sp. NPDC006697]|uniref:Gfo/Idh/MocA family oxidoreductase n=1 Tax=Kitasatospora sp. NPDC006697 TaxID=3364020 RepID=UPI0036956AF7
MFRTLIVGLGRAGAGLHLPVLLRLRREPGRLFADAPLLGVDPGAAALPESPELRLLPSLAAARRQLDPDRTVVHICTPPLRRTELISEVAELGFRRLIVEKPLAAGPEDLAALDELVRRARLEVLVVAPWLASGLTDRLATLVGTGDLGELRRITVRQHKPRFRRSLADRGHPTAFDVEMPHALGVALRLAGDGEVVQADWRDLRVAGQVRPALGSARLVLAHHAGARTEIVSDLASPVRERRITLRFARATATGHFAAGADDEYAQLRIGGRRVSSHDVFPDDALSSYLRRAYARFLAGPVPPRVEFDTQLRVVRLLSDAKRLSGADLIIGSADTERELSYVH